MCAPGGSASSARMRSYFACCARGERLREIAAEQRRRVGHRRIEPQPVEIVAEVVVRDDVALRPALAVGVEPVPEAEQRALPGVAVERALERRLVVREHGQQRRQVRRVPAAVDPRLGERDVAAGQDGAGEPPVAKPELAATRVVVAGPNRCARPSGSITTSSPRARRASSANRMRAAGGAPAGGADARRNGRAVRRSRSWSWSCQRDSGAAAAPAW